MTRGGSSRSRTLSSSVRPSVSSARRVSSGKRRGSLDNAVALISITTSAISSPRVISQSQPSASTPLRACLPRLAAISQLTELRLRALACLQKRAPRRPLLQPSGRGTHVRTTPNGTRFREDPDDAFAGLGQGEPCSRRARDSRVRPARSGSVLRRARLRPHDNV